MVNFGAWMVPETQKALCRHFGVQEHAKMEQRCWALPPSGLADVSRRRREQRCPSTVLISNIRVDVKFLFAPT